MTRKIDLRVIVWKNFALKKSLIAEAQITPQLYEYHYANIPIPTNYNTKFLLFTEEELLKYWNNHLKCGKQYENISSLDEQNWYIQT